MRLALQLTALALGSAAGLFAHSSWISVAGPLQVGHDAEVRIGHGHAFPDSEEALNQQGLEVFALSPSGERTNIAVTVEGDSLVGRVPVTEEGMYRFYFTQDRIIESTASPEPYRLIKSGVVSAAGAATTAERKPADLPFELAADRQESSIRFKALFDSSPVKGARVTLDAAGVTGQAVGVTGADGTVEYQLPDGIDGPLLFTAMLAKPGSGGEGYSKTNYSASAYFDAE